jgi:hypothetical protein
MVIKEMEKLKNKEFKESEGVRVKTDASGVELKMKKQ